MPLGEFTKQLAQQAILNATKETPKEPTPPPEAAGPVIFAQINALQKALKEDEELALSYHDGSDRIRVREIYMPKWQVALLSGHDPAGAFVRVIAPVEALRLTVRVVKAASGAKPSRVALIAPKT